MHSEFYLPEDPDYAPVDSARDSVRFAHLCLQPADCGRWRCPASCVDVDGKPAPTSPLATLEGPGWEANALGGALALHRWGRHDHCHILEHVSLGLADHVIHDGFVTESGLIRPYRDASRAFHLNAAATGDWLCPGWMARSALQLLWLADGLPSASPRVAVYQDAAKRCGLWLVDAFAPGQWFPRRCTPAGEPYARVADSSGPDPLADSSGDSVHIPWLLLELAERGLVDHSERVRQEAEVVLGRRGIFGSVAPDEYESDDTAARAVACRFLLRAARAFGDTRYREFALNDALAGIEVCKVGEDAGEIATRGLVRSAPRRDTASTWGNAECALAYLDAAESTGTWDCANSAATILRALARWHAGATGFLPGSIVWGSVLDDPAPAPRTGPLAGNLHHVEAVVRHQEMHAPVL